MQQPELYEPKTYLSTTRFIATDEWIEKNHLTLKRTSKDIHHFLKKDEGNMLLGFSTEVLIDYMDIESAMDFFSESYKEKVRNGEATPKPTITDLRIAAQDFCDYMNFAWGKAEDQRGISAGRSIQKLGAWLWLMGRVDLKKKIDDQSLYNPYGAPALIAICDEMEIPVPESLRDFAKVKC